MTESDENKPSGQNTQIVLALIGLVGAVSTGVFTNWDKIFPATSAPPAAVESPSAVSPTDSSVTGTGAVIESAATNGNAVSPVNPSAAVEVPVVASESVPQNLDLSGTWASPMLGVTEIKQDGNTVKGSYRMADSYGAFEGTVIENRLDYRWWQDDKRKSSYDKAEARGTGSFTIQDGGRTLVGRWVSETGTGGDWSLVKQD